jgi:HEAT repeats
VTLRAGVVALLAGAAGLVLCCAPAHDAQTLFSKLQSSDIEERQDAAETIDKLVAAGDYEVFVRGALSPVKSNRPPSIVYLARMKQPKARAALRDLLRLENRAMIPYNPIRMKPSSEESDSRILVANLIAEGGGDPEALGVLLNGAEDQPPDVMQGTCFAIGALHDPRGLPFLAKAVRHADVEVARAATQAVGTFHTPEALEILKGLVGHPSQEVRSEVLSGLALQDDPAVVKILEGIAGSDPMPELRAAAITQLARFKDPAPVPFLIEQLKGKDETNRQAALETLRLMSGQSFGPRADLWSRWWQQNGMPAIARP